MHKKKLSTIGAMAPTPLSLQPRGGGGGRGGWGVSHTRTRPGRPPPPRAVTQDMPRGSVQWGLNCTTHCKPNQQNVGHTAGPRWNVELLHMGTVRSQHKSAEPPPPPRQGTSRRGGRGWGLGPKSLCTKNGVTRFSQWYTSFSARWSGSLGGRGLGEGRGGPSYGVPPF